MRKAEVDRLYALDDRTGTLATLDPPLWDRFVPANAEKGTAKAPKTPEGHAAPPKPKPRHR
jgi:hypothetical protein